MIALRQTEYNISYEIVAAVVLAFLYLAHRLFFPNRTRAGQAFRGMIMSGYCIAVADTVAGAVAGIPSQAAIIADYVLNACCSMAGVCLSACFIHFVMANLRIKAAVTDHILHGCLVFQLSLQVVNYFWHLYYWFDPGGYCHRTEGIFVMGLVPLLMMGAGVVLLLVHRRRYDRVRLIPLLILAVLPIVGTAADLSDSGLNILGFTCSLALLVIFFTMETPDFNRLMETKKALEMSSQAEKDAKEEADSASLAKSRFLANMTHEIRTPINAIMGLDEIILRETSDPAVYNYAIRIRSAGRSLLGIVNDVLTYSRLESGRMQPVSGKYRPEELFSELDVMIEQRLQEKGVGFELDIDRQLPSVLYGDDVKIRQVLMNLLTNAVKYTEKGKVSLSVRYEKTGSATALLSFDVTDTGKGMHSEEVPELLKIFENGEEKRDYSTEGLGLGLNIASSLLDMMGSKLKISSEYGQGSSFSFSLEQRIADPTPIGDIADLLKNLQEEYVARESFTAPGASILVTDDTEINLFVIKHLLERTQIRLYTASSGTECLKFLENNRVDLVLMDYIMPDMDGIEAAEKLHAIKGCEDLPVVALTAGSPDDNAAAFLEKGFVAYLTKPVEQRKLEDTIMSLLPAELIKKEERYKG